MRLIGFAAIATMLTSIFSPALADPIKAVPKPTRLVVADSKFKPYTLVRIKCEGLEAKAGIVWRVSPSVGVDKATSPRGTLEFVAPPGVYQVECLIIRTGADGAVEVEEHSTSVEIESCCDKVPPIPPVPPTPEPPKGQPKAKADPVNALGRIQFGSAGCTATVIGPRRPDGKWDVLTAAHCVTRVGQRGQMKLKDGRTLNLTATAVTRGPEYGESDCCWCVTDETFADLAYAEIATKNPESGVAIWHMGYGIDRPGNREDGAIIDGPDSNGQMRMSMSVSSGDSGGGIFRADTGELVSVVCCTTRRLVSVVCCTTRRSAKATVFGCAAEVARSKRPSTVATEETWVPIEMPSK